MDIGELLQKHAPKTLDEFLGGFTTKRELSAFLGGHASPSGKNVVLLLGASGSGKTTLCQLCFGKDRFTITRPQYDQFLKHTDLEVFMSNFLTTRTLLEMMGTRPKLVFLDDVDVLLSQDRFAQSYLLELFAKYPNVRFVLTSSEDKRMTDLRKKPIIQTVRMMPPTPGEVLVFVTRVLDEAGYEVDPDDLLGVIKDAGSNLRSVFNSLMTQPDVSEEDAAHKYYQDLDIFPLVSGIMGRWNSPLSDLEVAISSEPTLMAYMMHENYLPWLMAKGGRARAIFEQMRKVNDIFCEVATLEPEVPEHMDLVRAYTVRLAQIGGFEYGQQLSTAAPPPLTFSKAIACNTQGRKLGALARSKGVSLDNLCLMAELAYLNGAQVPAPVKSKKKKPTTPAGNADEFVPYQQMFCKPEHNVYREPTLEERMDMTSLESNSCEHDTTTMSKPKRTRTSKPVCDEAAQGQPRKTRKSKPISE